MAGGDPARFGAMAACIALLTATIAFLAWLVKLLGEVLRGLPVPSLPAVHWEDLVDLLPLALARPVGCFSALLAPPVSI